MPTIIGCREAAPIWPSNLGIADSAVAAGAAKAQSRANLSRSFPSRNPANNFLAIIAKNKAANRRYGERERVASGGTAISLDQANYFRAGLYVV